MFLGRLGWSLGCSLKLEPILCLCLIDQKDVIEYHTWNDFWEQMDWDIVLDFSLGSISLSYFLYELHPSEQNPKLCRALLVCRARYSALKLSYMGTFILYHCVFNFQLKNLTEFVHLVQEGVELAQLLRVNLSFTNHLQNKTKWERNKIYLREMWKNLGPIICGPDPDAQPKKKVIDHMYDYRCRTKACKTRAMRLMLYLLLHNPKIAYSPNGTAADEIIKKVTWLNIRLLLFSLRASSHKLCSWGYS